ncbi:MAG: amidohydrolase family protein [Litorilinea sp.]
MIVDTHVHVWEIDPPRYPVGPTAPNWTSLPDEPGTAAELIADMDANGVDWSVLVQTSWSTWDNGYIADSVAAYPQRFVGHGLIDPLDANNAQQVGYWIEERGLVGFRFHPMYYMDQEVLTLDANRALWEEIARVDAVIQFHMRARDARQVAEIATRYPALRLIIDHLGYPQLDGSPQDFDPIVELAQYPNIYYKLSDVKGRSQADFPFIDVHPFLQRLHNAFGAARTMWGTGFPAHHRLKHKWLPLAEELRLIREGLPWLTEAEKDRILGGTAAEIWGLEKAQTA